MAYATLQELKDYLGLEADGDDELLVDLLAASQALVEAYCDQVFEATGDTTRRFDAVKDTTYRTLNLDYPLAQITTVTTDADGASPVVISATEYVTEPRNQTPYYAIRILSSVDKQWDFTDDSEMGITVAGRWAYSVTAPLVIKRATLRTAAYVYRQKDSQVFETTAVPEMGIITTPQGLPSDVKVMLSLYRRL